MMCEYWVYRYDRGWNAINEEDGAGTLLYTSVYAPGAEVGERLAYAWGAIATAATFYAYHDQLGSTRAWRWSNKNLAGRDDFAPYGEPITTTTLAPIDYALHVQDPNTLLYHAAYREYAAGWARWTTRDPLGMVDGPNMYAYAKDGPIDRLDLMGLACVGTWKKPWWCPWCAPQWVCVPLPTGCADRAADKYEQRKKECGSQEVQIGEKECKTGTWELNLVIPIPDAANVGSCLYKAYQQYQADLIKCALG